MYAYDYDIATGNVANRRVIASNKDYPGTFDGSTVDAEGYIWNAHVFGGRIIRYAPDGGIDRVIEVPVRNLTSVLFGGKTPNGRAACRERVCQNDKNSVVAGS